jgi:hypothetical protein
MANKINVLDMSFPSQKEAEVHFYRIRDDYFASGEEIKGSREFDLLLDLYTKYCRYTNWEMRGNPVSFCVRNIQRGIGSKGGTTQGFVVKFDNGEDLPFSAREAIQKIATAEA